MEKYWTDATWIGSQPVWWRDSPREEREYVPPGSRALSSCGLHGSRLSILERKKPGLPSGPLREVYRYKPPTSWEDWELRPLATIRAENAKELRRQLGIGEAVA